MRARYLGELDMLYQGCRPYLKYLLLSSLLLTSSTSLAAVYTVEPNKEVERNFNITGKEAGPYNIKVTVQSPLQKIIEANNATPLPPDAKQPPKLNEPPKSTLENLFPNLFGDESHHHGADGSDIPFTAIDRPPGGGGSQPPTFVPPPDMGQPFLPNLPPRLDDNNYVCYNYVYEQLTGQPTTTQLDANSIKKLLQDFNKEVYKPGAKLPDTFPPGTILFLNGHVGIVGKDGRTVFNYTIKSKDNGMPADLHKSPSAQDLWNTRNPDQVEAKPADYKMSDEGFLDRFMLASGETKAVGQKPGKQPYAGAPVETYTPPIK